MMPFPAQHWLHRGAGAVCCVLSLLAAAAAWHRSMCTCGCACEGGCVLCAVCCAWRSRPLLWLWPAAALPACCLLVLAAVCVGDWEPPLPCTCCNSAGGIRLAATASDDKIIRLVLCRLFTCILAGAGGSFLSVSRAQLAVLLPERHARQVPHWLRPHQWTLSVAGHAWRRREGCVDP
jgi:hypothetical protein